MNLFQVMIWKTEKYCKGLPPTREKLFSKEEQSEDNAPLKTKISVLHLFYHKVVREFYQAAIKKM